MALLVGLMLVMKQPGLTDVGHDCLLPPHQGAVLLQMQLPVHTTGIEASYQSDTLVKAQMHLYVACSRDTNESRHNCMQPVSCTSCAV